VRYKVHPGSATTRYRCWKRTGETCYTLLRTQTQAESPWSSAPQVRTLLRHTYEQLGLAQYTRAARCSFAFPGWPRTEAQPWSSSWRAQVSAACRTNTADPERGPRSWAVDNVTGGDMGAGSGPAGPGENPAAGSRSRRRPDDPVPGGLMRTNESGMFRVVYAAFAPAAGVSRWPDVGQGGGRHPPCWTRGSRQGHGSKGREMAGHAQLSRPARSRPYEGPHLTLNRKARLAPGHGAGPELARGAGGSWDSPPARGTESRFREFLSSTPRLRR